MTAPIYMQGTRSLDELISIARSLSYNEQYSFTEGWDDNVAANIFNLAQDKLYAAITQIDNPAAVQESNLDIYATQSAYDLPIDVQMALRLVDVRYLYGTQSWEFVTLRQGMIQDRFSYPTNIPDTFCIRNGQILLSPTPNITKQRALIINFQKRMRKLDIRRGLVASILSDNGLISGVSNTNPCEITTTAPHGQLTGAWIGLQGIEGPTTLNGNVYQITATGASTYTLDGIDATLFPTYISGGSWFLAPIQFQLDFTADSVKNVNMQAAANSLLDKVGFCCFVDNLGNPIMNAISLTGYNVGTEVLTASRSFVPTEEDLTALQTSLTNESPVYVVQGDYSSTHSSLDRQCEDALIEIAVLRFLRLTSSAEQAPMQLKAEQDVIEYLINQYRRYRPTIYPVVWQERNSPRSWPFGRRGMY